MSYDLASLVKDEERLALSIVFEINEEGLLDFDKVDIIESVIKNKEKLTYKAIEEFFVYNNEEML